jgi:hypothetical protein
MKIFSIVLLILAMAMGVSAQTYDTLLVNGAATPSQIPDLMAYRAVFVHMQDPNDSVPVADRVSQIPFTNLQDMSTFETTTQSFYSAYTSATTRAQKDAIVQNTMNSLNTNLSSPGSLTLNNYIQSQKSGINVYGGVINGNSIVLYTTYYSVTALYTGTVESIWDDYSSDEGYDDVGGGGGLVCSDSPQNPLLQYGITQIPGTVTGQTSSVAYNIPNGSTSGFGASGGYPGAGTIYTSTTTYKFLQFCTIQGRDPWYQNISFSISPQFEIAYTKSLNTGIAYGCWVNHAGVTTCWYPTSAWCQVPNPDYNPSAISDTQFWAAWYVEAACGRLGTSGPWTCVLGLAKGTTNQIRAGSFGSPMPCSYNP